MFWILGQKASRPFGLTLNRPEPPCWKGSFSITLFWLEIYIGWQANEPRNREKASSCEEG